MSTPWLRAGAQPALAEAPSVVPGTQSPTPALPSTLCPLQSASFLEGQRSRISS